MLGAFIVDQIVQSGPLHWSYETLNEKEFQWKQKVRSQ
jgi:hypothetical protein